MKVRRNPKAPKRRGAKGQLLLERQDLDWNGMENRNQNKDWGYLFF